MSNSLVGPRLLADIKRTISIVRGDSGGDRIIPNQTRFEGGGGGSSLTLCEFTGAWSIGAKKTINIKGNTAATMVVTNVLLPNIAHLAANRDCLVSGGILVTARC